MISDKVIGVTDEKLRNNKEKIECTNIQRHRHCREDREILGDTLKESTNPFGIAIEYRFSDGKKDKVSSMVVKGAETYVAGKCKKVPHAEEAFGYEFENLC